MRDALLTYWPLNSTGRMVPLRRLKAVTGSDALAWMAAVNPLIEIALPSRFRSKEAAEVPNSPESLAALYIILVRD